MWVYIYIHMCVCIYIHACVYPLPLAKWDFFLSRTRVSISFCVYIPHTATIMCVPNATICVPRILLYTCLSYCTICVPHTTTYVPAYTHRNRPSGHSLLRLRLRLRFPAAASPHRHFFSFLRRRVLIASEVCRMLVRVRFYFFLLSRVLMFFFLVLWMRARRADAAAPAPLWLY